MTLTPANDLPVATPRHPCAIDLSVLELATFMRVYRSGKPSSAEEIAATLSIWFRCELVGADLRDMLVGMVSRGFLANHARGFVRATSYGRRHARPHLYGVVQMLDSGTKMLDAAVMLSLVGIAAHELDGEIDNETIVD